MLPELGLFCTILAFSFALLQIFCYNTKLSELQIMRPLAIGQTFFCCLAFVFLAVCFINNDFSVNFVAQNSNSSLPLQYKIPAIWSAHEGSLLLWIFIVSFWSLLLAIQAKRWSREFSNAIFLIFAIINCGLLSILLFKSNPFIRTFNNIPIDGSDLNPLLQDIGMIFHPPILYMGYVGSTVGFAFACAALINRKLDQAWAAALRPWALVTWMFLTLGIALGSWWAYYELGWGGWWFWDPVENASFMPWLTSTALLHCLLVAQRYRQLLWLAVFLAIATFMLSLFGTFLVRSGSIVSVHAFAADPQRGLLFLILILVLLTLVAWWLFSRLKAIQVTPKTTLISQRISIFMFANSALLLVATGTILLGTIFPLLADFFGIEAISVGAPYFNIVFAPIMLILFVLMLQYLRGKAVIIILLAAALNAAIFLYINFQVIKINAWLAVTMAIAMLFSSYKRGNLSMQIAHIGLAIMLIGIGITPAYEIERDLRVQIGDNVKLGNFNVHFADVTSIEGANYVGFKGAFNIQKGNAALSTIYPEKRTYLFPQLSMSETAILPGILQDIYIALGQKFDHNAWAVRIYYKPYIRCIWFGALMMAFGAGVGIFYKRQRVKSDQ